MRVIEIPGFANILDFFLIESNFSSFISMMIMIGIGGMIFITFYSFPYGKAYQRGKSLLHVEIPDRVAYMIAHGLGPAIFVYAQLYYPNGDILSIPSLIFTAHSVHRALIYPWFRKSFSKPWPLETFLWYTFSNFVIGVTSARLLIFSPATWNKYVEILIAVGFIGFAIGAAIHDYKLCSLRLVGDHGYQIPKGLLFKWISGPNYALEILQWVCFIAYFQFGIAMATVGCFWLINLTGRAESNHDAYTKKNLFGNKAIRYPDDRTAYIPFIKNSRYFL